MFFRGTHCCCCVAPLLSSRGVGAWRRGRRPGGGRGRRRVAGRRLCCCLCCRLGPSRALDRTLLLLLLRARSLSLRARNHALLLLLRPAHPSLLLRLGCLALCLCLCPALCPCRGRGRGRPAPIGRSRRDPWLATWVLCFKRMASVRCEKHQSFCLICLDNKHPKKTSFHFSTDGEQRRKPDPGAGGERAAVVLVRGDGTAGQYRRLPAASVVLSGTNRERTAGIVRIW
jgi:hypothetical protein